MTTHTRKGFKGFFQKHYILILSFIIPVFFLEVAYLTRAIFPVGNYGLLIIDLYHQYAPFLSELQDKIRNGGSLLFSWSGGLGTSFIPLYSYYLASPLNIILVLFPKSLLTEAVLVLTLLKVGLAGGFFSIYLKGLYKKKDMAIIAFSVLYALSGYMMGYSWNIMWLDAVYLLPLIILGLTRLVRGEGGLMYAVSLGLALLANFYMAFFLCFFSAIYYPVCYYKNNPFRNIKKFFKTSLRFGGYSLLAGGLASVLMIPTYFALKLTSAAGDRMPSELEHTYDIFDYISRHFVGSIPTVREGMPNMYAGIVVLILIPVYFMSKTVKLKDKVLNLSIIFFIFISFNINILDFIWHGFHYPNQLPYRYSFLYIFLVLTIAYPAFNKLRNFSGKVIGSICASIIIVIVLTQKLNEVPPKEYAIYASIFFIIAYAVAFTVNKSHRIKISRKVFIFCLVVMFEAAVATCMNIGHIDHEEGYAGRDGYSNGIKVSEMRKAIRELKEQEDGFFRMEVHPPRTTNDPFLYNYNGLSIFSSTFIEDPVRTMNRLGYHSNNINSYEYENSTIIMDSVFGLKYILKRDKGVDELMYEKIIENDEIDVYKNPYAMSLGFLAPEEIEKWYSSASNALSGHNSLLEYLTGVENVLYKIDIEKAHSTNLEFTTSGTNYFSFDKKRTDSEAIAKLKIVNDETRQIYLYLSISTSSAESANFKIGEKETSFNPRRSTVVNLGKVEAGTDPIISIKYKEDSNNSNSFSLYAMALDPDAFIKAMDILEKNAFKPDIVKDTFVKGSIDAKQNGRIIITTPYDRGWTVTVDGISVETKALDNCFLSFDIEKGYHEIEMRFMPYMFIPGLVVTVLSILILAFILYFRKKHRERNIVIDYDVNHSESDII
jgi:uncharacterized membrane protein YfhO